MTKKSGPAPGLPAFCFLLDDDPASSNNQPGMFGIEIEATTKVSVRSIWVRKIN